MIRKNLLTDHYIKKPNVIVNRANKIMGGYRTYLIVDFANSEHIRQTSLYGTKLLLQPEPSNCYFESVDRKSYSHFPQGRIDRYSSESDVPQNELIIKADSIEEAEEILSVIQGGMLLAFPEPYVLTDFVFIAECTEDEGVDHYTGYRRKYFKKFEKIGFGCVVASSVLGSKFLRYALEKYKVSIELASFSPLSANPKYGQAYSHNEVSYSYHTRAAFAIISAFSVIEELGLDIRSSQAKPRFTNVSTGEWNPTVLADIDTRLAKAGISDEITFDWIYRGDPSHIEQAIKPFFGIDSEWTSYGEEVRDKTLTLPEAIHNASYLRNFVASHKFNELTQFVNPYDVYNVQALARLLIIHTLGLWQSLWHVR